MPTAKVSVKVKKEDTKPEVKTLVGSTLGAEADGETSSNVIDLRTQGRDISSNSQSAPATNGDMRMNESAGRDVPTQEVNGILDITNEGHGFLRPKFRPSDADVYISASQIRKFMLRPGDDVIGLGRPPKDNDRYYGPNWHGSKGNGCFSAKSRQDYDSQRYSQRN